MGIWLLVLALTIAVSQPTAASYSDYYKPKVAMCYYDRQAESRRGIGRFTTFNVDPVLCTHICYYVLRMSGLRVSAHPSVTSVDGRFSELNSMKMGNPKLKVMFTLKNSNANYLSRSSSVRRTFIRNLVNFMKKHDIDGVEFLWLALFGRIANHRALGAELQKAFKTANKLLLFRVTSHAGGLKEKDIAAMSKYADYLTFRGYTFMGYWDGITGYNAALFPIKYINPAASINYLVKIMLAKGCPSKKIILIATLSSTTYKLKDYRKHGFKAKTSGPGPGGSWTGGKGLMAYYEFCHLWRSRRDLKQQGVREREKYAYSGSWWINFEDVETVTAKACYVRVNNMGGIAFTMDRDDFQGSFCGQGSFPIITAASAALNELHTQCMEPYRYLALNTGFSMCKKGRYTLHPTNCRAYYDCRNKYSPSVRQCKHLQGFDGSRCRPVSQVARCKQHL